MCLFLESVKVCKGRPQNLARHQERLQATVKKHFGTAGFSLEQVFAEMELPASGTYKGRIIYNAGLVRAELEPYVPCAISVLALAESGGFSYPYKKLDRSFFTELHQRDASVDDWLLHHNGQLSDSTFANLAFFDGNHWYTPSFPLLRGVRRQQLLDEGRLRTTNIKVSDLSAFAEVSLINAMLDLGELRLPCNCIRRI